MPELIELSQLSIERIVYYRVESELFFSHELFFRALPANACGHLFRPLPGGDKARVNRRREGGDELTTLTP